MLISCKFHLQTQLYTVSDNILFHLHFYITNQIFENSLAQNSLAIVKEYCKYHLRLAGNYRHPNRPCANRAHSGEKLNEDERDGLAQEL